jgi:hypothetical protein
MSFLFSGGGLPLPACMSKNENYVRCLLARASSRTVIRDTSIAISIQSTIFFFSLHSLNTHCTMAKRSAASKFPIARIKRIMQADEDVGKVAQATPVVICTCV